MPRWLTKPLVGDNLPRKRQLALAIRQLLGLLWTRGSAKSGCTPPTQAELAERLDSNSTSLSRFASLDPRVPGPKFIETLHKEACLDAADGGVQVDITLEALQDLRTSADGERRGCPSCVELGGRIDSLTAQLNAPCAACATHQKEREDAVALMASLRQEATELRTKVQALETSEAGLQARLAMAKARRTPLPVPHQQRDRQRSQKEVAVARQLAAQARELDSAGHQDEALALLRRGTTELLSPAETALVIVELRQQKRDHLVDNLIHVYGRDQGDRPVMTVAAELHEEGAPDDAGAVLRAALK
ncbi:MmcB family DNA repair protein [Streptomyces sp. KHY 26]|uniref:MmcB family DNA repair protein n=1 Tax=Streptomyces sp. KHY 26 TaxID=3097359 RepID=UPI00376F2F66